MLPEAMPLSAVFVFSLISLVRFTLTLMMMGMQGLQQHDAQARRACNTQSNHITSVQQPTLNCQRAR